VLTSEAEVDAASVKDVRTACKLLLAEKALWEKRTEMHEKRCQGLEEMMSELVDTIRTILVKQKTELERIARISSEVVTACALRRDELEDL